MSSYISGLTKILQSQYLSELQFFYSILPDFNLKLKDELLMLLTIKEKHTFLSEKYKNITNEFTAMKMPTDLTVVELASLKNEIIKEGLQKIEKENPKEFDDTKLEIVFRHFTIYAKLLLTEIEKLETRINNTEVITLKLIDDNILVLNSNLKTSLQDLKSAINIFGETEYIDQEIVINFDTFESLTNRIKETITIRFNEKFKQLPNYKKGEITGTELILTEFEEKRKVVLDSYLVLVNEIKTYSEEQLDKLEDQKQFNILKKITGDFTSVDNILKLIKQRGAIREQLDALSKQSPIHIKTREDIKFFKVNSGYDQDFFENLGARLYAGNFIDGQKTDLQFAKIFSGKPAKTKINWVGIRAKAPMLYLMYLLFEKHKILEHPSQPFPIIANSFLLNNEHIEKDTKANDVLRSSYNKIKNGKYPGKEIKIAIEKILNQTLQEYNRHK